jgi:D-glycero-alpha-D-manno-heptose-7-phosphate kinase
LNWEQGIELHHDGDLPARSGLGSSSSFTVGMLNALSALKGMYISKNELAKQSIFIEQNVLNENVGCQDQIAAAFGGFNKIEFYGENSFKVSPIIIPEVRLNILQDNLLLFYTGYSRQSKKILINQKNLSVKNNKNMIDSLKKIKKIGYKVKSFLEIGDLESFGQIMNDHWYEKKKRSKIMSNSKINFWYEGALKNGAIGGKLVGAGGGGFLMFYAKDKEMLQNYFIKMGIEEIKFKFDFEVTKIIMS